MNTNDITQSPAAQEQAADGQKMQIDVSVRPIAPQGKLYAYADATLGGEDGFKIPGFQIKVNREGALYTDMPGGYDKDGNWKEAARPLSPDAYKQLNEAVLGAYQQEIESMRATLEATSTHKQAPVQEVPTPEQTVQAPVGTASEPTKTAAERPAAKQQAEAPAQRESLSGNLKKKAAEASAQQPPVQRAARGSGEIGA